MKWSEKITERSKKYEKFILKKSEFLEFAKNKLENAL